ncbi:MAG: hypothetical protein ACYTXC_17210 [Nostoc sp.]
MHPDFADLFVVRASCSLLSITRARLHIPKWDAPKAIANGINSKTSKRRNPYFWVGAIHELPLPRVVLPKS